MGLPGNNPVPCPYERAPGKQRCVWHWLLAQPADKRLKYARSWRAKNLGVTGAVVRDRVPKEEWPVGKRWCAGCQGFVPLLYCSGSRCKAHASAAAHEAMVKKTYGLEDGEYDALYELQDGCCYVCGRKSTRRLAVDHDHVTGAVRGLLCPDPERGCNHKVLGLLEANSVDGGLAAAKRLVEYLQDPPYERLKRGDGFKLRWIQGINVPDGEATVNGIPAHNHLDGVFKPIGECPGCDWNRAPF